MPENNRVENTHRVILVHGTFAASDCDRGDDWWQVGSDGYEALRKRLGPSAQLADEGQVFHWSGENSERARSKAAAQLLEFVRPHERSGQSYHLVGHSHGGSVIWSALRMATVRREELQHMRSWATVGTPFMHHRSRTPWSAVNLVYMLLASALIYPAARALWFMAKLPFDLAQGRLQQGLVIAGNDQVNPITAILRAPIIEALKAVGVAFEEIDQGIRVGSYDPDGGSSLASFLLGSVEGWLILFSIAFFAYLTALLSSYCVGPLSEVFRIAWEKRLEEKAFARYGQRWLGIWTPDDEAINGLRKTLELSMSFVGNIIPRDRIFVSDVISVPAQPLYWLLAPLYNRLVRPFLDSTVRNLVVKTAQGNNRPGAEVIAVSTHPVLSQRDDITPPLPSAISEKMLARANVYAREIGPQLREFLSEPTFAVGLEKLNSTIDGRELVHNSYFDHQETIELISMNILVHSDAVLQDASQSRELAQWFESFCRRRNSRITLDDVSSPEFEHLRQEVRNAA